MVGNARAAATVEGPASRTESFNAMRWSSSFSSIVPTARLRGSRGMPRRVSPSVFLAVVTGHLGSVHDLADLLGQRGLDEPSVVGLARRCLRRGSADATASQVCPESKGHDRRAAWSDTIQAVRKRSSHGHERTAAVTEYALAPRNADPVGPAIEGEGGSAGEGAAAAWASAESQLNAQVLCAEYRRAMAGFLGRSLVLMREPWTSRSARGRPANGVPTRPTLGGTSTIW